MKVVIIKYGMGNVASVQKALNKIGYPGSITDDHKAIREADFIILPGVGSFMQGMENLVRSGLAQVLTEVVLEEKKPFLGICLGMQLLATYGNEPEKVEGLGWIPGEVVKIKNPTHLRIPHLGWNTLHITSNSNLYGEFQDQDCYFIHSYCYRPYQTEDVTMTTRYDGSIVAALQRDHIYAMQFHPEKSQEVGLGLLKKVLEQYAKV